MKLILTYASLTDSWSSVNPGASTSSSSIIPPPHEALHRFGITADSPINSFSAGKPLGPYARKFWGKRLDYILYRQPKDITIGSSPALRCVESRVVLTDKVPGFDFSFSDHFGLESVFDIQTCQDVPTQTSVSPDTVATIIQALASCYRFSKHRAGRELTVSGLCILLLIALIIGSSWLPHSWINPIFMLFTVLVAWLATTMFYEGWIYGHWECNALMNVIEELEIFKKGLETGGNTNGTSGISVNLA
jgi:sphingomyelin phosphodiesterase 2